MPDNIDTTAGVSRFVSAREDAWHRLGVTLPSAFTAEQAMEFGHLGGWDVRKVSLLADLPAGPVPVPDRYAVVRDNPIVKGQVDVLGQVGSTYRVIQNEQHADLLNALVDESGAHFETAGALDGGRKVFITMKLPGHLQVGGVDRVDTYLAAVNSHDGGTAFTLMVTPVRIVCQNTLNVALDSASHLLRVRHTRGADKILVDEARRALDLTFRYLDEFQAEAEQLIQTSLTQSQFDAIITAEWGAPDGAAPATVTRTENKLDEMSRLFADAQTQEPIRGTAWAGFNALTEWADHFAPTRGDDRDTQRAQRAVLDGGFKTRALQLMQAVAS